MLPCLVDSGRTPLSQEVAGILYLASTSPRRRELLARIGVHFEILPVSVDESVIAAESPRAHVGRLALSKARAGSHEVRDRPPGPVLGADTVVVVDGTICGKPSGRDQAVETLLRLSGRSHEVWSAVALKQAAREELRLQCSRVSFRELSEAEALRYWQGGEPADKTGAYAIQGFGGTFVQHLEGSCSGVMGLPLYETWELLRSFGITPE